MVYIIDQILTKTCTLEKISVRLICSKYMHTAAIVYLHHTVIPNHTNEQASYLNNFSGETAKVIDLNI